MSDPTLLSSLTTALEGVVAKARPSAAVLSKKNADALRRLWRSEGG